MARVFLIEPSEVEYKAQTKSSSKRKPPLTYDELEEIAKRKGVGELYEELFKGLGMCFDQRTTTRSTVAFIGMMDGSRRTIFSIAPGRSSQERGVRFYFYLDRVLEYFGISRDTLDEILPPQVSKGEAWKEGPPMIYGYFRDTDEITAFLTGLTRKNDGEIAA